MGEPMLCRKDMKNMTNKLGRLTIENFFSRCSHGSAVG